jgi:PKD repeat protein
MDQLAVQKSLKPRSLRALKWSFFAALMLVAVRAVAGTMGLAWDPVVGPVLISYTVYYGTSAGHYTQQVDVGYATMFTVPELIEGQTYHFAVGAHDGVHFPSDFSNDVSATVPYSEPVADFSASTTSGIAPLAMNFMNTSAGFIDTYSWSFGDGTTSNAQNPAHVYTAAGDYTVTLTVNGPGGRSSQTRSNYVTVAAPPWAPPHPRQGLPRTPDLRSSTR